MGLMTQKDMAQQGSKRINEFLEESKLNQAQADKDEEARIFAQNHPDPTKEERGLVDPLAMFTPLASDVVDFDNAVGSAVAGDWEDAVWSAAAAIPLVGTPIVKALKPKKTVKAYKLFRTDPNKPGELFPLFVNAKQSVKQGEWVDAEIGPSSGKKVKSKIGDLAMRPGWHSGDLPVATHIGGKTSKDLSAPDYRPDNQVWAEVEMPDDVDWQSIATSRADKKKNGDIIARTAHITDQLPTGGHYRYKTNSNMTGNWLIGGSMKVNKVLSDVEVKKINDAAGVSDLPRIVSKEPKFNRGGLVDNEMETLNFNHGGVVHGKADASDAGAELLKSIMAKYKKGDYAARDAREEARVAQPTPTQDDRPTPSYDDRSALDAAVINMVADHKRTQIERAEEFSKPQGLTDKLSNLAEEGGNVLSSIGASLIDTGEEAFDFGENIAKKVYRKGSEVVTGAYNNLTAEVDEEMARLQADTTPTKISQEAVPPIVTDHRGKAALERGVRNNNPLNIKKKVSNAWDGIAEDQSGDSIFATFESAEYGIRAALRTLVTYQNKHKLRTPSEMLARWAPPSENIVSDYVATVKELSGLSMDDPMVIGNNQKTLDLIRSMIAMENSQKAMRGYSSNTYNRALQLAFPTPKIRDDEPLPKERKLDLTKWNEIIK